MSVTTIDQLSDDSKVWIFGASAALSEQQRDLAQSHLARFLREWTAHGTDVPAAVDVPEGQFILVAADEAAAPGGCSIDRLFRFMNELGRALGVSLLDSSLVFYRDETGRVTSVPRSEFKKMAAGNEVTAETPVFDISIDRLRDYRAGRMERAAGESWHRSMLAS